MEQLKIFISGTQDDLQPERKAVAEVIRALGHEPVMAETYGGQPMPSLSAIREMLDQADIYVGVYGARYGWKMDSVSVTEFEFTEFRCLHPDRILYYIKEIQLEPEQNAFLQRVQDFNEGYFRRPKFKDRQELAEWVKVDLAQFIARVVHEKLRGAPDAALIHIYLQQLAAQKIPTLGTDTLYLDRAVVPSVDLFARPVAHYDPIAPERDGKVEPESLQAALAREKKLMLLGEPGQGKTTSLQHLAREIAQSAQGEIPIYAELKYYDGGELETLLAQSMTKVLATSQRMLAPDLAASTRVLKQWLAQSNARFLLLLDGLNEVRPDYYTAIRNALDTLFRFPHRIIVSCRERDYDKGLGEHATTFVLQPLQKDEILAYLQRTMGNKGEELFDDQIGWYEKMLTLAGNPLMLWLITLVAQSDPEARLPENRGKLFQKFVAQMPQLRRREHIPGLVPLDVVETALAKLGFEMLERNQLTTAFGDAYDWVIPTAGKPLDQVLAQAKEWRLLKSDGQQGEPIEFLHQLFQEYFAALHLNRNLQPSTVQTPQRGVSIQQLATVLGDRPFDERWYETLGMLAGICAQPAELVKWLGTQVIEKKQGRTALLASFCWRTSDAAADPQARVAVIDALIVALRDPDADLQRSAAEALVAIGAPAIEPLIIALRGPHVIVPPRAAEALGAIGAPAIDSLIVALGDPDKSVRGFAAYALGQIGDARAVEPLIVTLHDPDKFVLGIALLALEIIGAPAVEPLIGVLYDPDANVRLGAASTLGTIGAPAVEPLIVALRDPDADVRDAAAYALGEIKDARALPELERVAGEDKGKTLDGESVADEARKAAEKIRMQDKSTDGNG